MTRDQIVDRRNERILAVAKVLYTALECGDHQVKVKLLPKLLPDSIRFRDLPKLHRFLHSQPLTLKTKKEGPNKGTAIPIDSKALCFIADALDMDIITLLKMRPEKKRAIPSFMSLADFYQKLQDIPDFAPMGDPVFTLTQAPQL